MKWRAAAATSDGIMVNQHFGRCGRFTIVEMDEETGSFTVVELREITPVCGPEGHAEDGLEQAARCLSDCKLVIVARIGLWAEMVLKSHQIEVVEYAGPVAEYLNTVLLKV